MAVGGLYIAYRIRRMVLPFVRVYGQWVEERIIPLSDQLQKMAEDVEKQTYDELMSQPFGEEYLGDGSEEAETAHGTGLSFYEDISKMYQATLNLFSAGLFHVMEQQLSDLTRDGAIEKEASDSKLDKLIDWYKKGFQLDLQQFPDWWVIDELRLVANSTKHAEGPAAKQLREKRPELFIYPALRKDDPNTFVVSPLSLPLGGDGLYVTGDEFRRYHKTVLNLFEWLMKYFEDHGEEYYPR
jgi:hypothetical protein